MYGFEAHYIDVMTNERYTKVIELEGQFYDSEKQIFLDAMNIAYDHSYNNRNLMFDSLEFIYC